MCHFDRSGEIFLHRTYLYVKSLDAARLSGVVREMTLHSCNSFFILLLYLVADATTAPHESRFPGTL